MTSSDSEEFDNYESAEEEGVEFSDVESSEVVITRNVVIVDTHREDEPKSLDKQAKNEIISTSADCKNTETDERQIVDENSSESNGWDFEEDDIDVPQTKECFKTSADDSCQNLTNHPAGGNSHYSKEPHHQTSILQDDSSSTQKLPNSGSEIWKNALSTGSSQLPSHLNNQEENANAESGWNFDEDLIVLADSGDNNDNQREPPSTEHHLKNLDNSLWSSWGNWGVTSLINTASEGVSSLSTQVTSGFTTILENTIGAPDPQELASQLSSTICDNNLNSNQITDNVNVSNNSDETSLQSEVKDVFGIGSLIGGVKNLSTNVFSGGIDTLETLGKKTMAVLQKGDPGWKKKRAFFEDKVILSQVLREAKEKAEAQELEQNDYKSVRKAQYETLFDDFHGLVHLEALEMISKQCEVKSDCFISDHPNCNLDEVYEAVNEVSNLFSKEESNNSEPGSECDLKEVLNDCAELLALNLNLKNIIEVDTLISTRINEANMNALEMHANAISDLAQFTALSIEIFHRVAEMLIVKEIVSFENDIKALARIASATKSKIGSISEKYSAKLMGTSDKTSLPLVTNVFLEASNSSSYLDNAFELFIPLFQCKKVLHTKA